MSKPVGISLPKRAVPVMTWLAKLDETQFQALRDVATSEGNIQSRSELIARFGDAITDEKPSRGAELVTELFGLLGLSFTHGWSPEDVVAEVSSGESISLDDRERENLRRRLNEIVSSPPVKRLAKAFDFYSDHPNLLHFSQILTDIRPIMGEKAGEGVVAAIITHTLKINYQSAGGRQEIYIALDDRDLEDLSETVARAKQETARLEEFIKSAGVADMSRSAE